MLPLHVNGIKIIISFTATVLAIAVDKNISQIVKYMCLSALQRIIMDFREDNAWQAKYLIDLPSFFTCLWFGCFLQKQY